MLCLRVALLQSLVPYPAAAMLAHTESLLSCWGVEILCSTARSQCGAAEILVTAVPALPYMARRQRSKRQERIRRLKEIDDTLRWLEDLLKAGCGNSVLLVGKRQVLCGN